MMDVKKMQAAAKKIAKGEKIFITRNDDNYYICDGYIMVRANQYLYREAFQKAAPEFIELEPGEGAQRLNKRDFTEKNNPINSADIIKSATGGDIVNNTGFMKITEDPKCDNMILFMNTAGEITAVSDKLYEKIEPFINGEFTNKNSVSPLIDAGATDFEYPCGVLILPMRQELKNNDIVLTLRDNCNSDYLRKKENEIIKKAKEEAAAIAEEIRAEERGPKEKASMIPAIDEHINNVHMAYIKKAMDKMEV